MVGYSIPIDGVVGRLLQMQDRHPYRPADLHALIVKPGYKVLISQVYDPADPHIETDVQFGRNSRPDGRLRCATTSPFPGIRQ
jgi:catechol 1,2-dioxygenase